MTRGTKIGFIGGGNMAGALVRGLLARGVAEPGDVIVAEPVAARRAELESAHGVRTSGDNATVVTEADVIVLAIKPQVFASLLPELARVGGSKLVVSIAAGVPIATMEGAIGEGARVVRAMPNTPALAAEGATAIAIGAGATAADAELARALFDAVGTTVIVAETALDAVTGLSGSGPGFVFQFIEALADGGVRVGLPRDIALRLAAQTVRGAATLVLETGRHPGELKDMVTSPGGTTIAGVHALERGALRGTVIDAVEAATARSAELGRKASER